MVARAGFQVASLVGANISYMQVLLSLSSITVGALLLFLIQPMMAKAILPIYGGSASVWTACLVFYQGGLLVGYFYAYILSRFRLQMQCGIHGLLLLASTVLLPIQSDFSRAESDGSENAYPQLVILVSLMSTVGLQYLLLASTSPLIQRWASLTTPLSDRDRIFRLFAISNLGSLLGLLSYPFLIEPLTKLSTQFHWWSVGYTGLIVLFSMRMLSLYSSTVIDREELVANHDQSMKATWSRSQQLLCILLAANSTIVLGASTNQISQVGVVVPFVWIAPLTLYLCSFVLCYQWPKLFTQRFWTRASIAATFLACSLLIWGGLLPISWQIAGYCMVVFAVSMGCHAELYANRPTTHQLTKYYLLIALGGALGGAFTGLLAPKLFSGYWEFHLGIASTVLIMAGCGLNRLRAILLSDARARNVSLPGFILSALFVIVLLVLHRQTLQSEVVDRRRDFYGVASVVDDSVHNRRMMIHGNTQHGVQPLDGSMSPKATMYFGDDTGIAKVIQWCHQQRSSQLHLGVIGLGTGSILVHVRPGDSVEYYEISSVVESQARKFFSYIANHDSTSITMGDGRLLLERQFKESGSRHFDLLVVDAFSGDALPRHLLTLQALQLYQQHVKPTAPIAFHITNRYLDLAPIIAAAADQLGMIPVLIESPREDESVINSPTALRWMILFDRDSKLPDWVSNKYAKTPTVVPWTDDFGSLWSVLR